VEGHDRAAFLQGQLTQEVLDLRSGMSRLAAGLTPQGKLLYFGRLVPVADALLLLVESPSAESACAHLARYAAFQKVTVRDATPEWTVVSLYGPEGPRVEPPPEGLRLPPWGELSSEVLAPVGSRQILVEALERRQSVPLSLPDAEIRRVEAGRPSFGLEATPGVLPQEAGLSDAVAGNKGCYVGQEVVARIRTYGRLNRRLSGLRFPGGPVEAGAVFPNPEKPSQEIVRVTSSVPSPRFGPIGLGLVFRDLADGARVVAPSDASRVAVVCALPFS
jgi:folate-binding protein YgfZ